jgi:hypothetical protein
MLSEKKLERAMDNLNQIEFKLFRLIFRGSFDFFPSKLTKYGNGNYIILNRMKIFNVT